MVRAARRGRALNIVRATAFGSARPL